MTPIKSCVFGAAALLAAVAGSAEAARVGVAEAGYVPGAGSSNSPHSLSSTTTMSQGAAVDIDIQEAGRASNAGQPANAVARQNLLGFSHVGVDALPFSGGAARDSVFASSVFSESIVHQGATAADYQFRIFLKDMALQVTDFAGAASQPNPFSDPTSRAIGARISYDVAVNGVTMFRFVGDLFGGRGGSTVDLSSGVDGVAPDGSVVSSALGFTRSTSGPSSLVDFSDLTGTLDVGRFAPGEAINLVATMRAEISAPPFELGGIAVIGDPNDLSSGGVLEQTGGPTMPPAPLPASAWLLIASLGALAATRRRAA